MKYRDRVLTLDNFQKELESEGYSLDILDEVRSAILDGLPLAGYLHVCRNNPWRLHQIRLAMKEGMPLDGLRLVVSGHVIEGMRRLWKKGIELRPYVEATQMGGVSERLQLKVLEWYEKNGIVLEKYDFTLIPESLIDSFDRGIKRGLPMWVLNNGVQYDEGYMRCVMSMLGRGRSVASFLNDNWRVGVAEKLAGLGDDEFDEVVEWCKPGMSEEMLDALVAARGVGLPLGVVGAWDGESASGYRYAPFQVEWMTQARERGMEWKKMLDPGMGSSDLSCVYREMELEKDKWVSGTLRKSGTSVGRKLELEE